MTSITISGSSHVSEGAAIAATIAKAHSGTGGDAPGFHIIILSVTQGEGGWQAFALVVRDPELESILHRRLRKEHDREEYARTHLKKSTKRHHEHQEYHEQEEDFINKDGLLDVTFLNDIFVYLSTEYEPLLETLKPDVRELTDAHEQDVHFHLIEKDSSLWENVLVMTPDYDFNKAALTGEDLQPNHAQDTLNGPEQKLENNRKPLLEELVKEA